MSHGTNSTSHSSCYKYTIYYNLIYIRRHKTITFWRKIIFTSDPWGPVSPLDPRSPCVQKKRKLCQAKYNYMQYSHQMYMYVCIQECNQISDTAKIRQKHYLHTYHKYIFTNLHIITHGLHMLNKDRLSYTISNYWDNWCWKRTHPLSYH